MTEKQEKILLAALRLFANEGYAATSTSRVAKEAGVSEGLIFRHFKNKEGLLDAVLNISKEASNKHLSDIVLTSSPKEVISKMLELPFSINPSEYELWRLTYAIKWQTNSYDTGSLEPVKLVIANAFEKLGYSNPQAETELLFMFMDGAATTLLLHAPENKEQILSTLKEKYKL